MKFLCDHDLHIHSNISSCSTDPNQTPERILRYAKENDLKTICLTDHFWDSTVAGASDWYKPQNFEHISSVRPLPQADGIRFLFGCETEMDKNMTIGISKKRFDEFDFVIIPTTHFHMTGFTISKDVSTPREKADFWVKKFNTLLDMDLPFYKIGIPHMTCGLIDSSREKYLETLDLIDKDSLVGIFRKVREKGCGIELNSDDMDCAENERSTIYRLYFIAREVGCKFYCGSDAHDERRLDRAKSIFEKAIDLLELTEDDKFII